MWSLILRKYHLKKCLVYGFVTILFADDEVDNVIDVCLFFVFPLHCQ